MYSLNKDYIFSKHENGGIALNTINGNYLDLNSTAMDFIESIESKLEKSEIIAKVANKYNIDESNVQNSFKKFISDALKKKLIVE